MGEKMDIENRLHEIAEVFTKEDYNEDCTNNFLGDSSGAVLFLLYFAKQFGNETVLTKALNAQVFFTAPYSSWQKGTVENANKPIRQYIDKQMNINNIKHNKLLTIQTS